MGRAANYGVLSGDLWVNMSDRYHRGALAMVQAGAAQDADEAKALLGQFRLQINLGPECTSSVAARVAAETIALCGGRAFLGGITFEGPDIGLSRLGARAGKSEAVSIAIGTASGNIHLFVDGLRGGIVLPTSKPSLSGWSIAAIAAAAVALTAAWDRTLWNADVTDHTGCRLGEPRLRPNGVHVLRPGEAWHDAGPEAPPPVVPQEVFVLGLGHLGQAFLRAFAALPFTNRQNVALVLQDYDRCTEANVSTSVLCHRSDIGEPKTRLCARWLEEREIFPRIIERRFDTTTKRTETDPPVLVAGVDKLHVRRLFDDCGFSLVLDGGLGSTPADMTQFQLTSLPAHRPASEIFSDPPNSVRSGYELSPEFARLSRRDACGAEIVANTTVGLPFIGTLVGALMVGQLLAHVNGVTRPSILTGDARNLGGLRRGTTSSVHSILASQASSI